MNFSIVFNFTDIYKTCIFQGNDRREEKHFDESGPSHGKRHRRRTSPHRLLLSCSSYIFVENEKKDIYLLLFAESLGQNAIEKETEVAKEKGKGIWRDKQHLQPHLAPIYQVKISFLSNKLKPASFYLQKNDNILCFIGTEPAVFNNTRMALVGGDASGEHELANGYNSGDEYTGRTGNNLTVAEWQEVKT